MILLLVIVLTVATSEGSTGTFVSESYQFSSKEMCEGYRLAKEMQARPMKETVLISKCSKPDEPAVFDTYGMADIKNNPPEQEKLKQEKKPKQNLEEMS